MGGYYWEGVSKKIGAREQQLLLVMANPLHRRLTKALLLNRGDVMGRPKPYLVRVKTVLQLGSPPSTSIATILVISNNKKARGKIECQHVKEDVGECY